MSALPTTCATCKDQGFLCYGTADCSFPHGGRKRMDRYAAHRAQAHETCQACVKPRQRLTLKTEDEPLTDAVLLRAIGLLRDRHFPALSIGAAFGGGAWMAEWRAIAQHTPATLFAEAHERGLDVPERKPCSCCGEYGASDPIKS